MMEYIKVKRYVIPPLQECKNMLTCTVTGKEESQKSANIHLEPT